MTTKLPPDLRMKLIHPTRDAKLCDAISQIRQLRCKKIDAFSEEQLVKLTIALQKTHIDSVIRDTMVNSLTAGRYGGSLQLLVGVKMASDSYWKQNTTSQFPWAEMHLAKTKISATKKRQGLETLSITLAFLAVDRVKRDASSGDILNIYDAMQENGHETLVLIDHDAKSIEYFDPHGIAKWNLVVWPVLAKEIGKTHAGYQFVPPWETCPLEGMQSIYNIGLCEEYSTLYEFLRFRCPHVPAFDLQVHLTSLGEAAIRELILGWLCFKMTIRLNARDTKTRKAAFNTV